MYNICLNCDADYLDMVDICSRSMESHWTPEIRGITPLTLHAGILFISKLQHSPQTLTEVTGAPVTVELSRHQGTCSLNADDHVATPQRRVEC